MTKKELLEKLKDLPDDLPVYTFSDEGKWSEIRDVSEEELVEYRPSESANWLELTLKENFTESFRSRELCRFKIIYLS